MKRSYPLSEWEADADAPPRVVSSTKEGDLQIALLAEKNRERRVVFRSRADDGSWTISKGTPFFLPHYSGPAYALKAAELKEVVAEALSVGHVCRVLFWRHEAMVWRVSLAPAGVGLCQAFPANQMTSAATPFAIDVDILGLTSSEARDWVEGQRRQEDSALSLALRFHRMTREERLCHVLGFGDEEEYRSRRAQLERLMQLALWSHSAIWKKNETVGWRIGARHGFQITEEQDHGWWNNELQPPHLEKWASWFRRFGPLVPDLRSVTFEHFWNGVEHLAQTSADAPTMHEQLEAKLELRDWAREHLPPDEFAEMERLQS